jgi:hypothetical protein
MKALLHTKIHPAVILFFKIVIPIICVGIAALLFHEAILAALRMSEPERTFLMTSGGGYITYQVGKKKARSIYNKLFKK